MARIEIGKNLLVDHRVCGGRLIFKGTRILVSDVLELSRAGLAPQQVAEQYAGIITADAVREAKALVRRGLVKEILLKTQTAA